MCDYCGCRRSGPTKELHEEHLQLNALGDSVYHADRRDPAVAARFAELVDLLERHAAKEEIGLFVHGRRLGPLAEQIETLCREHDDLRRLLGGGPQNPQVPEGLRLLATHIDDEEYDLFPHIFHALDPEQWEEIELAQRAIDVVWTKQPGASSSDG